MSFFCEIRDERGRLNYVTDECQTVDQVVTWYRKHNVPFDKVVFDGRQSYSFLERPKELLLDRSEVFPRGIPRKGYYISVACRIPDVVQTETHANCKYRGSGMWDCGHVDGGFLSEPCECHVCVSEMNHMLEPTYGLTAYNLCYMPDKGTARLVHKITVRTISMMERAA